MCMLPGFHKGVLKVRGELEDSKEEELHPDTGVLSPIQGVLDTFLFLSLIVIDLV